MEWLADYEKNKPSWTAAPAPPPLSLASAQFRRSLPASRLRGDHIRVHWCRRARTTAEPAIRLLRRCAADLRTIRRSATRAALRHDVRSMHVCEGLQSAGLLAVARFAGLSGRVPGSCGSWWGCL